MPFLSEIDTRINSINSFFARPFILFSEDLSQNLHREIFIVAAKSRNRCIGCATEKRNIMLPLYSRVYLVMHR